MLNLRLCAPTSVDEAIQTLAQYGGEARPIAGGTALVLMMRQGLLAPSAVVRLDRVPGLDGISVEDGLVHIGAMATLGAVSNSPLVRAQLPVLAGACGLVGNVRVRNVATLAGCLCEADYASDPPGVLVALDARVRVQGPSGARELAVQDLVTGFYETALAPDELVTDVLVPVPPPGARAAYLKYSTRSSEDRPCLGTTALLNLDEERKIRALRVAVGAVAEIPLCLPAVEATALGQPPTEELFAAIAERYAEAADPITDVRGSAAYRRKMTAVFVRRALQRAAAGESGASRW